MNLNSNINILRSDVTSHIQTHAHVHTMPSWYLCQLLGMLLWTSRTMKVTRQQVVGTVDKHPYPYMDNRFMKYHISPRISLSDKWKNVRGKDLWWIWLLGNSFGNYIHPSDRSLYHKLQFSHRGSTSWNMSYIVDHICIPSLYLAYHITFTVYFICMQLQINHPWP